MALTPELLRVSSYSMIWLRPDFSWMLPAVQVQLKSQYCEETNVKKNICCDLSLPVELQAPGVVPNLTERMKILEEVRARPHLHISRCGTNNWQTG